MSNIELNKIHNQDCIKYMKTLPNESVNLIIADPPYFKIVKSDWDNQWKTQEEYLNWCNEWTEECFRILKPSGNFYVCIVSLSSYPLSAILNTTYNLTSRTSKWYKYNIPFITTCLNYSITSF